MPIIFGPNGDVDPSELAAAEVALHSLPAEYLNALHDHLKVALARQLSLSRQRQDSELHSLLLERAGRLAAQRALEASASAGDLAAAQTLADLVTSERAFQKRLQELRERVGDERYAQTVREFEEDRSMVQEPGGSKNHESDSRGGPGPLEEPLTDRQRELLAELYQLRSDRGLEGKELAQRLGIQADQIRDRVIRSLRERGFEIPNLKNRTGYFLSPEDRQRCQRFGFKQD
ncbi:hypothetical protein OAF85_00760 [Planctomycetota bacterium]|nr:hypothetical protein [Planctomycetota bacterium]